MQGFDVLNPRAVYLGPHNPCLLCFFQCFYLPCGIPSRFSSIWLDPEVVARRTLRVKIADEGLQSRFSCQERQIDGRCRFADSALLL